MRDYSRTSDQREWYAAVIRVEPDSPVFVSAFQRFLNSYNGWAVPLGDCGLSLEFCLPPSYNRRMAQEILEKLPKVSIQSLQHQR